MKNINKELIKLNQNIQQNINDFNALMNLGTYNTTSPGGIYKCTYLKDPRYVYIGRTINFKERWYNQHEKQLKNNTHCGYFQQFFNEHNCSIYDFEWSILEYLPIDNIEAMKSHEKIWIQKYNHDNNYILLNSQKYN